MTSKAKSILRSTKMYSTFFQHTGNSIERHYNTGNNIDDDNESAALIKKNDDCMKRTQRPDSYRNHFYWLFSSLKALVSYKFIGQVARLVTVSVVGHLVFRNFFGCAKLKMASYLRSSR